MTNPTPEEAPDGFWEDFGKFVATKSGLFEKFLEDKNTAPAPEPESEAPADPVPSPKKKGWFDLGE